MNASSGDSNALSDWPVYQKNQLVVGNKQANAGVCTLWTNRDYVARGLDASKYAVVGNLYSFYGINHILRNILANPNIRYIVLCGLDNSKSGSALKNFFELGVDENNFIKGFESFGARIDLEIPANAISTVRENVELIDLRPNADVTKISETLEGLNKKRAFGVPTLFPESVPSAGQTLPSEETGFRVDGKTVAEAWLKILKTVMDFGSVNESKYGRQKEVFNLIAVVTDEDPENVFFAPWLNFSKRELEEYYPLVLSPEKPEGLSYTYGQRMRDFKGFNQIECMKKLLKQREDLRNVLAVLYDPLEDNALATKQAPCITQVTAGVRGDKLFLTANIRSNDMFDAWPRNAFALRKLQKELADAAGLALGALTTISHSAHIYENSWNSALEILEKHYPKRVAFEEDPRGNFLISLEGGKVVVEHATLAGKTGKRIEGKSVKEVLDKLVLENLVSRAEHWAYLGKEIQNAFDCLREGRKYVQDVA